MSWKDNAKQYLKERNTGNVFKMSEGDNTIRILPNKKDIANALEPPMLIFGVHREVGPNKRFVRCGKDGNGAGKCWLCDVKIPALAGSEKEGLRRKAKAIEPSDQVVFQVAWLEDGEWKGPKPLYAKMGKRRALGNRLVAVICGPKPYDHPVKGRNLVITRTGQGLDTDYGEIGTEDEPTAVPKAILAKLKDFDELAGQFSKEFQMAVYEGREQDLEEETEDDANSSEDPSDQDEDKQKKPIKKSVPEPEPDENETLSDEVEAPWDDPAAEESGDVEEKADPTEEEEEEEEKEIQQQPTPKRVLKKVNRS